MDPFTAHEQKDLLDRVAGGAANPPCPRCGGACAVIHAAPRRDVSYVRDRIVVWCSDCLRSFGAEVPRNRPAD